MILAAGLSPAWQQTLVFEKLNSGEVNRASKSFWRASGKVLNVGVALERLQVPTRILSTGGGWALGGMETDLNSVGVEHRWVVTERGTRVCTTVIDLHSGQITELVENSGEITEAELELFRDAFLEEAVAAKLVVVSGSLPARTPSTYYRKLLQDLDRPMILDFRGEELLQTLPLRPFLVKPNRFELGQTLGRDLSQLPDLREGLRQLTALGAIWGVISDGPNSTWICHGEQVWRVEPPGITAVNPIGSGDCLAAGIAAATYRGAEPVEAVRFGIAAAVENATQLLACQIDPPSVERWVDQITLQLV